MSHSDADPADYYESRSLFPQVVRAPGLNAVQRVVLILISPILLLIICFYTLFALPWIVSGSLASQPSSAFIEPSALSAERKEEKNMQYTRDAHGLWVLRRYWLPPSASPVIGVLILIHGLGEHCHRVGYEELAERLNMIGYAVYAADHIGHGFSTGERCYTQSFAHIVDDQLMLIKEVSSRYKASSLPLFILGHSLGGLIAVHCVLRCMNEIKISGLILSSPAIIADPSLATPFNIFAARLLSFIAPKFQIDKADPSTISRSRAAVERYVSDPLVYQGKLKARFAHEILLAQKSLSHKQDSPHPLSAIKIPVLLLHGDEDFIVPLAASQYIYDHIGSTDKKICLYKGRRHEIWEDTEKEPFYQDIINFIKAHTMHDDGRSIVQNTSNS